MFIFIVYAYIYMYTHMHISIYRTVHTADDLLVSERFSCARAAIYICITIYRSPGIPVW